MNTDNVLYEDAINVLTEGIIRCSYQVSNALGCGFLEKVYENALTHELRKQGLKAEQQQPIEVWYDGVMVGSYVADIIVKGKFLWSLRLYTNSMKYTQPRFSTTCVQQN